MMTGFVQELKIHDINMYEYEYVFNESAHRRNLHLSSMLVFLRTSA